MRIRLVLLAVASQLGELACAEGARALRRRTSVSGSSALYGCARG